jgi:hypothetical protein
MDNTVKNANEKWELQKNTYQENHNQASNFNIDFSHETSPKSVNCFGT